MDRIDRLVGVYDADGSLRGELSYVIGHLLGRRSCSLCDITHGALRRRAAFDAAAAALRVPFDLVHRDERSSEVAALTGSDLPCVVAEGGSEQLVLLHPDDLAACDGDPAALVAAIRTAARARGMALGAG